MSPAKDRRRPFARARPATLAEPASRTPKGPLVDDRHAAAVLRPGRFVVTDHRRAFLAVADGSDAAGGDAERDQRAFHRVGAAIAEREVVFARAAVVAMAFDRDFHVLIFLEPGCLALKRLLAFRLDVRLVEVEEDAIADVLDEILARTRRGVAARGRRALTGGAGGKQQHRPNHRQ